MRNHVKNIFLIFYGLFFVSCVYFNTFYNAQNSFNKAIEIIDNESSKNYKEEQNISNIAKKLLYESISSSNIVINKYPDSKYIDDAIYYIARSYLSLNELYKSEKLLYITNLNLSGLWPKGVSDPELRYYRSSVRSVL